MECLVCMWYGWYGACAVVRLRVGVCKLVHWLTICVFQVAPALTCLTDLSCWKELQRLRGRRHQNLALDTRYSSRHWHANEITVVARDADAGTVLPFVTCTPFTLFNTEYTENREGGIVARHHMLKDTASGARQHPLRTYKGTANTAEADGSEQLLLHVKVRFLCATSTQW